MSLSTSKDAIFDSLLIRNGGVILNNTDNLIPGTIRFNSTNKTFEGYTGEPGPLGETWRELTLDIASAEKLGGVRVGANLFINEAGILSSSAGVSRILQNIVTVAKELHAADFTTIADAISYIDLLTPEKQPSATNQYKIIVSPGVYTEAVTLPDYVSLQGEGQGLTIIRRETGGTSFENGTVIRCGHSSRIENLEIQHYQGTSNVSVGISAFGKTNVVIQNVTINIGHPTDVLQAGVDSQAIHLLNAQNVSLDNVRVNITQGTGIIYGINADMTYNTIVYNTEIKIDAPGNLCAGIYHQNLSDGEYNLCNFDVKGGQTNAAVSLYQSTPLFNSCKLIASASILDEELSVKAQAYGFYNNSTEVRHYYVGSNYLMTSNSSTNERDTIRLPSTSGFVANNYIKVAGAIFTENNNIFMVNEVTSTDLILGKNLLKAEGPISNITIEQLYTIELNGCYVQATNAPIFNTPNNGFFAFKCEKSVLVPGLNGPTINNGIFITEQYHTYIVAQEGGDFKNVYDAVESITDNSQYNRYTIIVKPGIYQEKQQIMMKPYVNIIGSGQESTVLVFDVCSSIDRQLGSAIVLASNSEISQLTIQSIATTTNATYRIGLYGNEVTNTLVDTVTIIATASEYLHESVETTAEGVFLNSPSDNIILRNLDITANGAFNNAGIEMYSTNATCPVVEIRNGSIQVDDPLGSYNYGILSNRITYNMIGTKITVIGSPTDNTKFCYGIKTLNEPAVNEYLIQFFSVDLRVSAIVDQTNYGVYASNYQTIIGGSSNIVGTIYYSADAEGQLNSYKSSVKLFNCWSVSFNGTQIVFNPLSGGGAPISGLNGNLFVGDNAGNNTLTGSNNTVVGNDSGYMMTTAFNSTLLGFRAGESISEGNNNTFLGKDAGRATNTGDNNTFTGYLTGITNRTGSDNSAYGSEALKTNYSGDRNVAIGRQAGYNLTIDDNVMVGFQAGYASTTAQENVMIGSNAGLLNTTGDANVLIGYQAGLTGNANNVVAVGHQSGYLNTGDNNTFVGKNAGYGNTTGQYQTMIGYNAGITTSGAGDNNTFIGPLSGASLSSGAANTMIGVKAGQKLSTGSKNLIMGAASDITLTDAAANNLTTGSDNIILGTQAAKTMTTGSKNVIIGNQASQSLTSSDGTIAIGYAAGAAQTTQAGDIFIGNQAGKNNNNIGGNLIMIGSDSGSGTINDLSTSIMIGKESGQNLKGSYNIGVGYQALKNTTLNAGSASGNVFVGHHAGMNLTTGNRSVGIGGGNNSSGEAGVLSNITNQSDNTAVGYLAGQLATSSQNTLVGSFAGNSLINGGSNTLVGYQAGKKATSGESNVQIGSNAGLETTSGSFNTSVGVDANNKNTTGSYSVAVGNQAGYNNLSDGVISVGYKAGRSNTSSENSIFIGREAAANPTSVLSGAKNVMIGYKAGYNATTTSGNVLIGDQSGYSLTTGSNNVLIGDNSGNSLVDGEKNIFIGSDGPGFSTTSGSENIFIGSQAGVANTTGSNNLFVGNQAGIGAETASDNICIGNQSGFNITNSQYNLHIGSQAGFNNLGERNISIGYQAGFGQGPVDPVNTNDTICIGFQAGLQNQSDSLLAIGTSASSSNTTGQNNISIGGNAGRDNTTGSNNILIGENAGAVSNSDGNIFIGKDAGIQNLSGANNMIIGNEAGAANVFGNSNIFLGYRAGNKFTTDSNIAIGNEAGFKNVDGQGNIYFGYKAGRNTTSDNNTFIGNQSGQLVTTGQDNLFLGNQSGRLTTTGSGNFFVGYQAGYNNTTGNYGLFSGYKAGESNTTGKNSLFIGYESGANNTTGDRNLGIGFRALKKNQTGDQNIAIGSHAMYGNKFGINNLVFGANAVSSGDVGDNNVVLGSDSSRIILNPSFTNNIAVGYKSNFQGFASTRSIIMGANAVSVGAGGENNIIMGENSAVNLGEGNSSTSPTSSSNIGSSSINIGSSFVKAGQYLVLVYDNNSEYEPQIVYTTAVTTSTATISSQLTWYFGVNDKAYLLYGNKSSVIEAAISGESFIIVKTPKLSFDALLPTNTRIVLQSITSTITQVVTIVSTQIQTGNATTGTTKVNIDQALTNTYAEGDVIFLGRLKDDTIGVLDGSLASSNIIMGFDAGNSLTMGSKNIAIGDGVLRSITTEKYNTALGANAGYNVKSENNLLLGTRAGYNIDTVQGTGSNTMIGYAAGLYSGKLAPSSNNLYIGNRVGQVNQGSNNIFIGNETELEENENSLNKTTLSNKLAIYNSDGGIPSNPLIGGDLNANRIGIATLEPTSTLDVKGSFSKAILAISQFDTQLTYNLTPPNYTYDRYLDKTATIVNAELTLPNFTEFNKFPNSGSALIDSEFIIYTNKESLVNYGNIVYAALTGVQRGAFNSSEEHHLKSTKIYDIGAIKGQNTLACNVPNTGVITLTSTDTFILPGTTALAVIGSEIIQFSNKNTGLGKVTRGYNDTVIQTHSIGANVYNIATSLTGLITTTLTNDINSGSTNIPLNPTGFYESGALIIDSEIMTYTDNKAYLFNISRGTNGTTALPHLSGVSAHLIQGSTTPLINSVLLNLIPPIEDPLQVISIADYTDFYSSGFLTLNGEIIKYDDIDLLNIQREQYQTSKPVLGVYTDGTRMTYIADGTTTLIFNFLDQELTPTGLFDDSDITGLPPNTIILRYGGDFPDDVGITHTILIDKELIDYRGRSNNFLLNCVRGQYGTEAASHLEGHPVFLIPDSTIITSGYIKELLDDDNEVRFQSGHQDFPTSGLVLIEAELIQYDNMGLYHLIRGFDDTSITSHNISSKIYNFEMYYGKVSITNAITTNTQQNIAVNDVDVFTTNGTILVDSELITYYDGVGLREVTRGYLTSATGHITLSTVFNVPPISPLYSTLNAVMNSEDTGIPTQNNINYGNSGLVLINSEIMSFESKNTLDNVIRGSGGTIASSHISGALVSQIDNVTALTRLAGSIKATDDSIVLETLNGFTSQPIPSTVQIQTSTESGDFLTEVIQYSSIGNSLVTNDSRGIYGSNQTEHSIIGIPVYNVNEGLTSVNLGTGIELYDLTIPVANNADLSDFTNSGTIRIGYEIMYYQYKNRGLGLSTRNFRGLPTGATSHAINTIIYDIKYNGINFTMNDSITGDSKIKTTDTSIPVIESTNSLGATGYIIVNNEIIYYSSLNDTLSIPGLASRGLYNTSVTGHNNNEYVYQIIESSVTAYNIINSFIGTSFIPLNDSTGYNDANYTRVDKEIIRYENLDRTIYTGETGRAQFTTSATGHVTGATATKFSLLDNTSLSLLLSNSETDTLAVDDISKITNNSGYLLLYDVSSNNKEIIQFATKSKSGSGFVRGSDNSSATGHDAGEYFNLVTNTVTGIELLRNITTNATCLPFATYTKTVTGIPTYNDYQMKILENGYIGISGELISYTNRDGNFSKITRPLSETHIIEESINCIRQYNYDIPLNDSNYIVSPELPVNYFFTIKNITQRDIYGDLTAKTHTSGAKIRQISTSADKTTLKEKSLLQPLYTDSSLLNINNLDGIPNGTGQLIIKAEVMTYTKNEGDINYLSVQRAQNDTLLAEYITGTTVVFLDRTVNNGYIISTTELVNDMSGITCNFRIIENETVKKENNQQLNISTQGIMLIDEEAFIYNDQLVDINNFGDFTTTIKPNNQTYNYAFDSMVRGITALNSSYTYTSATAHSGLLKKAIHISRDNNLFTTATVTSGITQTDTDIFITITNISTPENSSNYFEIDKELFITIKGEIIKCTLFDSGTAYILRNCVRGYLGTTPASAVAGTTLFKIYEPYEFYIEALTNSQTRVFFWPGNMQIDAIGTLGYFRVDDEIIRYSSTLSNFTSKLLDCERDVIPGNKYPPVSLLISTTVSNQKYGNGVYTISVSSETVGYEGKYAFDNFNITTTLTSPLSPSATSMSVNNPIVAGFLSTEGYLVINDEIIKYTTATTTSFNGLVRGEYGTSTTIGYATGTTVKYYSQHEYRTLSSKYNSTSGAYTGTTTTTDNNSISYSGEYIQFSCINGTIQNNFYPKMFYIHQTSFTTMLVNIFGSNNGTTWYLLYSSSTNTIVQGDNYITPSDKTKAYSYYRCVIRAISAGSGKTYAALNQFAVYGDKENLTVNPIFTVTELNAITAGKSYKLMNDLTITSTSFTGLLLTGFDSTFDGNDKTITVSYNFSSGNPPPGSIYSNFAIFKNITTTGIIKNLNIVVTQGTFYNFTYSYIGGLASTNNGTIQNCNVTYNNFDSVNLSYVGGLVAKNSSTGVITNCSATFNFSAGSSVANSISILGGLVGLNEGLIKYSKSSGTTKGFTQCGGLVGTNIGTIQYCYSDATLLVYHNYGSNYGGTEVGGLIGYMINNGPSSAQCLDSYWSGYGYGGKFCGGLIGTCDFNTTVPPKPVIISRCYVSGQFFTAVDYSGIDYTCFIGRTNKKFFDGEVYDPITNPQGDDQYGRFNNNVNNCLWLTPSEPSNRNKACILIRERDTANLYPGYPSNLSYIKNVTNAQILIKENYLNYDFLTVWNFILNTTPTLRNMTYYQLKHNIFTPAFVIDSDRTANLEKTTLKTRLNVTDKTIFVMDSIGSSSGYLLIDNELIKYYNKNDNGETFYNLNRGLSKTGITDHPAGTIVYIFSEIPKKLFINKSTINDTTIEYDLGPGNGYNFTNGGLILINNVISPEFIRVLSNTGYNYSTHKSNDNYCAINSITLSSQTQYISDIITTIPRITNTDVSSDLSSPIYYYLAGNSLESSRDIDTAISSSLLVSISSINYISSPPGLSATTITISTSTKVYLFNKHGGHILLTKYNGSNVLTHVLLVRYQRAVDNILYGVTLSSLGPNPNFGSTISFTNAVYIKTNDTLVDPYAEGPLLIGQNEIPLAIRNSIPVFSTIIGLKSSGTEISTYNTSNNIRHRSVTRYYRRSKKTVSYSTLYNFTQLINIDELGLGFNTTYLNNTTTNVFIKSVDDFGINGFMLMNNEILNYSGGYGLICSRGVLNTLAKDHAASVDNYNYTFSGTPTTITNSISASDTDITLTNNLYETAPSKAILLNLTGIPTKYEIITNGIWSETLNNLTRNILTYNPTPLSFNVGTLVYEMTNLLTTSDSILSRNITPSDLYISVNNGQNYPRAFLEPNVNTKNYILVDKEIIKLTSRYSLDTITRNYGNSLTATTTTTVNKLTSVNNFSRLRQNITANHLFIPLLFGNNYTTSGKLMIDGEWMNFNGKNSFDIANISTDRGLFGTETSEHSYDSNYHVLAVDGVPSNNYRLRNEINSTTKAIPLNLQNDNLPLNGILLIGKEFMLFNTKSTFELASIGSRGLYETDSLVTAVGTPYTINSVQVQSITNGILRTYISEDSVAIPVVDGTNYPSSGTGLIEGEFFIWDNKNTLDGLTRGLQGTTAKDQTVPATINVVTRLGAFIFVNGVPVINSFTIDANDVLLSDDISGIRIKDTADIPNLPSVGTVLVGNEKIIYNTKETIIDLTRGTNGTSVSTHTQGTRIYNISNTPNDLVNAVLAISISTISSEITLDTTTGFGNSGYIIIGSEIISYTSKSSNILSGCERGKFNTSSSSYSLGESVYYSPLTLIGITKLDANMSVNDKMISVLDVADLTSNPTGLILINSEIIKYESIADLTRGTNLTTPVAHLIGTKSYTISTTPNVDLYVALLDGDITSTSTQILLDDVSNFGDSGYVIIDSEIIQYTSKDTDLPKLLGCTRGKFMTIPSQHSNGSYTYYSPLTTINSVTLTRDININDTTIALSTYSDISTNFTALVLIDSEIIKYETSTGLGKLIRGVSNTTIKPYPSGTNVVLLNIELSETDSTVIVNTDDGDMTINLPSATSIKGRIYTIKKSSNTNNAIITPVTTQLIEGRATFRLKYLNEYVTIQSDGSNWVIIASNVIPVDSIDVFDREYPFGSSYNPSIEGPYGIIDVYNLSSASQQVLITIENSYVKERDIIFTQLLSNIDSKTKMITINVKEVNDGFFKLLLCDIGGDGFAYHRQKIAFHVVKARSYRALGGIYEEL